MKVSPHYSEFRTEIIVDKVPSHKSDTSCTSSMKRWLKPVWSRTGVNMCCDILHRRIPSCSDLHAAAFNLLSMEGALSVSTEFLATNFRFANPFHHRSSNIHECEHFLLVALLLYFSRTLVQALGVLLVSLFVSIVFINTSICIAFIDS